MPGRRRDTAGTQGLSLPKVLMVHSTVPLARPALMHLLPPYTSCTCPPPPTGVLDPSEYPGFDEEEGGVLAGIETEVRGRAGGRQHEALAAGRDARSLGGAPAPCPLLAHHARLLSNPVHSPACVCSTHFTNPKPPFANPKTRAQVEEEFEIDLNDVEPEFLRGQTTKTGVEMSPIKIVKNPDGSMQRAAMTQVGGTGCHRALQGHKGGAAAGRRPCQIGARSRCLQVRRPSAAPRWVTNQPHSYVRPPRPQSALAKERRELREQQNRMLIEAIPKDLSKPWEDPLAGARWLAGLKSAAFDGAAEEDSVLLLAEPGWVANRIASLCLHPLSRRQRARAGCGAARHRRGRL